MLSDYAQIRYANPGIHMSQLISCQSFITSECSPVLKPVSPYTGGARSIAPVAVNPVTISALALQFVHQLSVGCPCYYVSVNSVADFTSVFFHHIAVDLDLFSPANEPSQSICRLQQEF